MGRYSDAGIKKARAIEVKGHVAPKGQYDAQILLARDGRNALARGKIGKGSLILPRAISRKLPQDNICLRGRNDTVRV